MFQPARTQIRCPNCGQPFAAAIEQIIDGGRDPQAKARFLAGRTNVVTCPNCRFEFKLAAPLLYHDASKELLAVHMPMELGLPQMEQDRVIGAMTKAIVNSLPQEQRKGYLLIPKTALTLNGMMEMVLEADGVTREMIELRREKLRLAETFLQSDPAQWPDLARQNDDKLDEEFFAMLAASADAAAMNGRDDVAAHILELRERLLEFSTVGQELLAEARQQIAAIEAVRGDLESLGEGATQADVADLALRYADDDEKLQALVGLARPVLDYQFFMVLSEKLGALQGETKDRAAAARDKLVEYTRQVDVQTESVVQQAAQTLQDILESQDIDTAIQERLPVIDDTFLAVLSGNIQHAEQSGNLVASARLKQVFERVMALLQENAPPPIRFVNELLRLQDDAQVREQLQQRAAEFGPELLQLMDVLLQELETRGSTPTAERLRNIRRIAEQVLANPQQASSAPAPGPDEPKSGIILPFARKGRKRE